MTAKKLFNLIKRTGSCFTCMSGSISSAKSKKKQEPRQNRRRWDKLSQKQQQIQQQFRRDQRQQRQQALQRADQKRADAEYQALQSETGVLVKARGSTFYRSSQALEKNCEKERHHWEDAGPTDSSEQPKQNAAEQKEDGEVLADQATTEDVDTLLDEIESTASALAHRLDIVRVNDLIDGIYGSVARLNVVGLLPVVCSACGIKLEAVIGAKLDSMQQHLDQDHQLNAVHLFAYALQSGIQIKVHDTEIVGWFAKRCKIATLNKIVEGHVPCIQMDSSLESDQASTKEVRQSNHQWLRDDVNTFIDALYLKTHATERGTRRAGSHRARASVGGTANLEQSP